MESDVPSGYLKIAFAALVVLIFGLFFFSYPQPSQNTGVDVPPPDPILDGEIIDDGFILDDVIIDDLYIENGLDGGGGGMMMILGFGGGSAATTFPNGTQSPSNVTFIAGYCNATTDQPNNIGYNFTWYLNGAVNSSGVYSVLLLGSERGSSIAFYNESGFTDGDLANDSDYSTKSSYTAFGNVSAYWNYTKPANSTGVIKWQAKHGTSSHVTDNTTLTAGCSNQSIIQLKITANNSNTSGSGTPANSSKNGTSFSDNSAVGTITWSNPTYANKSDNIHSNASITTRATTHYLNASNFGFSIPAGATITGIQAAIERKSDTKAVIYDVGVYLLKAGATTGTNMKSAKVWGTADATILYGNSTNLWGTTWTPAEVNATSFGLVLSANNTGKRTAIASVDYMNITVFYNSSGATSNYSQTSKFCHNGAAWQPVGTNSTATNNFSASDIYEQDLFFNTASGGNTSGLQVMVSNITPTITTGQNWILQCTAYDGTTARYNSTALFITSCGCGVYATPNYVCNMDTDLAQSASCFWVQANNVTINGNGHSITGTGAAGTYGIRTSSSNTTIRDATINNYPTGFFSNGGTTRINMNNINITASTDASSRGLDMSAVTNSNISNIIITVNGSTTGAMAIVTSNADNNIFTNITARAVGTVEYGVFITTGSDSNTFINTNISTTTGQALYFDYSNSNNFTNLTINTRSTGITMNGADNNAIDCQGGTVAGNNGTSNGIAANGHNTILSNCIVTNFSNLITCANKENLTMSNLTIRNTRSTKEGIYIQNCPHSTLTNSNTAVTYYGIRYDRNSNLSIIANNNLTSTGTTSTSAILVQSNGNTIENNTATCYGTQACASFSGLSGSNITNITTITLGTGQGLALSASASGNTIRNSNLSSRGSGGVSLSQANDNAFTSNLIFSNTSTALTFTVGGASNRNMFLNNTFASGDGTKNLTLVTAGSANNTFCLNNFTATTGVYINDKTTTTNNSYNCTYEGKNQGNIYANVINGSVEISGSENSSIADLYIGNGGVGFPYSNSTSQGKVVGNAVDYAPLTPTLLLGFNVTRSFGLNKTTFGVLAWNGTTCSPAVYQTDEIGIYNVTQAGSFIQAIHVYMNTSILPCYNLTLSLNNTCGSGIKINETDQTIGNITVPQAYIWAWMDYAGNACTTDIPHYDLGIE